MKQKFAVIAGAVLTSLTLAACNQSGQPLQNQAVQNHPGNTTNSTGVKQTSNNTTAANTTNTTANATAQAGTAGNSTTNSTGAANAGSANQTAQNTSPSGAATTPSGATSASDALPGNLLIADRGNSRLLIVNPQKQIIWEMSIPTHGPHNANSLGADDAFFTPDGKHIIINEEDNQMLGVIDIATKKFVWTYGHPGVAGSAPGYLNTPDDAYMLPNGDVTVADIKNQRILFISPSGHVIKQYGTTGYRYHNPPKSFAAPNGDTPLPDGGTLVTEIGGSYADRLDPNGKLSWTVHFTDINYPSDAQLLENGNILVADYSTPGRVEIVTQKGARVWEYYKTSGPGKLAQPSLAKMLPNGYVIVNDYYNHRVVIINPSTNQIVWQYGHSGVAGTAPGYLNTPDGMDFMPATWTLPTVATGQ